MATEVLGPGSGLGPVSVVIGRQPEPNAKASRWSEALGLDVRSLALFRIALGLYLVADLIWRLPLIRDFYTDSELVPRAAVFEKMNAGWFWSIHLISGELWVQVLLFLTAIVFAIGMTAGYRTRLCTACSWFLFSSMHIRDPFVQYFADQTLQAFLFWAIFLPLNGRWSLDAVLTPAARRVEDNQASWATQAFILQMCFIYWFTALMKWDRSWLTDGSAVYYALSLDFSVRPLGHFLLGFPGLLRFLSRATIAMEFLGPLLILSPWRTARLRLLAVVLFVGFHTGLALTMDLTGFSAIMFVGWLAFLPGFVWEAAGKRWSRAFSAHAGGIRGWLEEWVSTQRTRSDRMRRALAPPAPTDRLGPLSRALVLAGAMTIFATSMANAPITQVRLPKLWFQLGASAQLNQQWAMFAAPTYTADGWYVIDGLLVDGRHADVWRGGGEVNYAKPADVPASYRNGKWRAYLLRLSADKYLEYRRYFGSYLCRHWNAEHSGPDRVNLIYISYMLETTVPPGQVQSGPTKRLLWRHYCLDKPAGW